MFDIKSQLEAISREVEMRQHHALELGNKEAADKLARLSQTLKKALTQVEELLR